MILEKDDVRLVIEDKGTYTSEKIQIKDGIDWVSILGSNEGYSTLNFWSRGKVYSKNYSYIKRTKKKLYYELDDKNFSLKLDYCLEENNLLHIRYVLSNKKTIYLSKYLVNYAIFLGNDPDYTWAFHLRPKEGLVLGDHVYRSPAIIYKKRNFAFSFIPDLKTLGRNRPYQSFADFNLKPKEFRGVPQVAYGFGNYKPVGHILFKHNPMKKWKIKANTDLTFRYYVILFKDKSPQQILEYVNNFFWNKFGTKLLNNSIAPQVVPYDKNAEEGFKAIIERHKIWGDFNINTEKCGGFWQTSWMGKKKSEVKFIQPEGFSIENQMKENMSQLVSAESVSSKIIMHFANSPFWIKRFAWFTQTFPVIKRNAEVWFNAWFNNMRSAYGFRFFGEKWNNEDLKDKAVRILNTFLNAPRVRGLSSSVILPANLGDTEISEIKGLQGFLYVDKYCVADCSLSTYWALKFSQAYGIKLEEVQQKARQILELLQEQQFENGEIPAYIDFKEGSTTPIISDILKGSATSGAPLMLFTEYIKVSNDKSILPAAEKIAQYIQREIIPNDKWHDFEPFYSCTHLPTDFYDSHTKSHVMNGLCIYWCTEGMKELFKITKNESYLKSGERILAVLSLFQQVWDAPYISFNTYGGFCSQNIDAELSDARQGLFIKTYMEYYLLTGKREYMERAIAALRGSWAMQFLPEYKEQCPGNVGKLKTLDTVDRGVVAENYGHSGNDLPVPGYWMADWGFGTSVSATAYAKIHFGDLFIDFKGKLVFGIDGILIKSYNFEPNRIIISCNVLEGKDYIIFKGRNAPESLEIELNGKSLGRRSKSEIDDGFEYILQ
ncbi:MAG: hypothetical protein ACTSR8_00385 [Promethearchaeota archaeon]